MAVIRPQKVSDIHFLPELFEQLGYPSSLDDVRKRCESLDHSDDDALFVAVDEAGHAVGWLHVKTVRVLTGEPRAQVMGLVVDREHRREGIATALLAQAEKWAAERGLGSVTLYSQIHRDEAHEFYRSQGYEAQKRSIKWGKRLRQDGTGV